MLSDIYEATNVSARVVAGSTRSVERVELEDPPGGLVSHAAHIEVVLHCVGGAELIAPIRSQAVI